MDPKDWSKWHPLPLKAFEDDINYRIYGTQPSNKIGYKFNFYLLDEGLIYEDENVICRGIYSSAWQL